MKNIQDLLFAPLGKEWCVWYFILLVIAFIGFVMTTITSIASIFTAKKFTLVGLFKNSLMPILASFIYYFLARLGYSICVGALH
jgi:hypothetical protein